MRCDTIYGHYFVSREFAQKYSPNQYGPGQDVKTESVSTGVSNETNYSGSRKRATFFFVDTYLIQTTTQNVRINLEAMASPPPVPSADDPPLIPDDLQWEIISQGSTGAPTVGHVRRVQDWTRGVVNANIDVELQHSVSMDPARTAPMTAAVSQIATEEWKSMEQRGSSPSSPSSWKKCGTAWVTLFSAFMRYVIFCPVYTTVAGLDCLGGCFCCYKNGCCSDCCLKFFPVCVSEDCWEYINLAPIDGEPC